VKTRSLQTRRADRWFIISATLIFVLALLVTVWDFVQVQRMIYRFGIANAVGLGLFLIGVSIRIVARRTLSEYFSSGLKTSQKHELVKHGIYRHIRHPAYLGSLLLSIGIPLIFSNLYGFSLMLGLVPCFLYRIKIEESMLIEKFGNEHREYMKQTKKMIPSIF
jgi:protein-S-isoprenylcysteine O-methyltransferase Ste14